WARSGSEVERKIDDRGDSRATGGAVIRKLLFFAAAIVVIGAGVALYVAAGYVATPTVVVKNESDSSVEVTAFWRETSRELGRVEAGSERRTRVRDEAAMTFRVV